MIKFNLLKTYKVNYSVFNSKLWHIEHKKLTRVDEFKLDYTTNKLSTILNQIYIISKHQTRGVTPIDTIFYRNIAPNLVTGKRIIKIYLTLPG